ncbi:MAG: hypothetical protein ACFCD0_27035 [Gemmataceae bacterium]
MAKQDRRTKTQLLEQLEKVEGDLASLRQRNQQLEIQVVVMQTENKFLKAENERVWSQYNSLLAKTLHEAQTSGRVVHNFFNQGGTMTTTNITGDNNQFNGCAFGDKNSLNNYFDSVDNLQTSEDELKQKLKEAREEVEKTSLPDEDKADVVDDLVKLAKEFNKPQPEESRVRRFWNQIKSIAPTVSAILSGAVAIAKLIAQ